MPHGLKRRTETSHSNGGLAGQYFVASVVDMSPIIWHISSSPHAHQSNAISVVAASRCRPIIIRRHYVTLVHITWSAVWFRRPVERKYWCKIAVWQWLRTISRALPCFCPLPLYIGIHVYKFIEIHLILRSFLTQQKTMSALSFDCLTNTQTPTCHNTRQNVKTDIN